MLSNVVHFPGSGSGGIGIFMEREFNTSDYKMVYYASDFYNNNTSELDRTEIRYAGLSKDSYPNGFYGFLPVSPNIMYVTSGSNSIGRILLASDSGSSNTGTLATSFDNASAMLNLFREVSNNKIDGEIIGSQFYVLIKRDDGYPGIGVATIRSDSYTSYDSLLNRTINETSQDFVSFSNLRNQFSNMSVLKEDSKDFICFSDVDYVAYGSTAFYKGPIIHESVSTEPSPGYASGNYPSKILYPISK